MSGTDTGSSGMLGLLATSPTGPTTLTRKEPDRQQHQQDEWDCRGKGAHEPLAPVAPQRGPVDVVWRGCVVDGEGERWGLGPGPRRGKGPVSAQRCGRPLGAAIEIAKGAFVVMQSLWQQGLW